MNATGKMVLAFVALAVGFGFCFQSFGGPEEARIRTLLLEQRQKELRQESPVRNGINGNTQVVAGKSVRKVLSDGRVEDLTFREPPAGMTYTEAFIDGGGNTVVMLGGRGKGFNFRFKDGPVLVSSLQQWEGVKPDIKQMVPNVNRAGFLALDSAGRLYSVEVPNRQKREFVAKPIADGPFENLFSYEGVAFATPHADDELFTVVEAGEGKTAEARKLDLSEANSAWLREKFPKAGAEAAPQPDKPNVGHLNIPVADGVRLHVPPAAVGNALDIDKLNVPTADGVTAANGPRAPPATEVVPPRPAPRPVARYEMPFTEYQALVRKAVTLLPDLGLLWALGRPGVFFGGGGLRGLLNWLDEQILLRQKSGDPKLVYAELSNALGTTLMVPKIEKLTQKGADKDIWVKTAADKIDLRAQGFSDWDILTESFHSASVKAGGAALEKLQVNPNEINDPYGALNDWYHGKISFRLTSRADFESTRDELRHENSQTALALRFLRFAIENPQLEISEESWKALHELAERETRLPSPNWWLDKGIAKMYRASGGNILQMIQLLDRAKLIGTLVASGHGLLSGNRFNAAYMEMAPGALAQTLSSDGLSMDARAFALGADYKTLNSYFSEHPQELTAFVEHAATLADFLRLYGIGEEQAHIVGCRTCRANTRNALAPHLRVLANKPDARAHGDFMGQVFGEQWQAVCAEAYRGVNQ